MAILSVCALALAVVVSCISRLNVGVLAVALAWIVGVYIGGMPVATIMNGFPSQLFLTLTGVTLLFALAETNGTLSRIAHHAVRVCRGNRGTHSDHVLRARRRAVLDGTRQHRHRGPAGAARDGYRRADRHPAVPHGDHGRQRRQLRRALSLRPDRHHRQRHHGQERPAGARVADVSLQPARARARGVRRLRAVRRRDAVWPRAGTGRGRRRRRRSGRDASPLRRSAVLHASASSLDHRGDDCHARG